MERRRVIVFGVIIALGILVGYFCLPSSNDEKDTGGLPVPPGETKGTVPIVSISDTPSARARALFEKALPTVSVKERAETLRKAHELDPKGCWGGAAAAELGDMWRRANNLPTARQWYEVAAAADISPETRQKITEALAAMRKDTAGPTTLSRVKMLTYKVQPNDSLWKIAKRYATTIGALKAANGLKGDLIRVNSALQVPKGPFDVRIAKSTHTLYLLQEGKVVKAYRVALGDARHPTPVGTFVVKNKLVDPVWYSETGRFPPGDPRNVLGSRWIGFDGRIGIHGCRKQDEGTIGRDVSNGCVRMRDADAQDVYNYLVEQKSKVTIAE